MSKLAMINADPIEFFMVWIDNDTSMRYFNRNFYFVEFFGQRYLVVLPLYNILIKFWWLLKI